ncbi:MAG: protein kinase [Planctomycetes bacterium]|nr:protein kinase [Planctomycetota bacterium]
MSAPRWKCPKGHETDALAAPSACPVCGDTSLTHHSVNGSANANTYEVPTSPAQMGTIDAPSDFYKNRPDLLKYAGPYSKIVVKGYDIVGELGRGGMGVVYKAKQSKLNRFVALKMILAAEHAGPNELGRFQIEAEAIAQLQHPNIVQIYEVGETEGRPFFSLEFVDGGSLAQKLQQLPQPARSSAILVESLARAISAAHGLGVIHRDLKPANVLLATPSSGSSHAHSLSSLAIKSQQPFGIPKITDFGLAKRIEGNSGNTQSGSILGTPSYMAPEQAAGNLKEVGPRSDIYALGAILYEMLTGRPPFLAESPFETLMQVMRDEPIAPRSLQPKLPRDIEIITLKCLEKNPAKRYQTADELGDDLKRFVEGEPISARAATKFEQTRKWMKRHPAATGLTAVAAVAISAMIAGAWFYHDKVTDALAVAEQERDKLTEEQKIGLHRTIRLMVSNGNQHVNQGDYLRSLPWFAEALRLEHGVADNEEMHRVRLAAVLRHSPRLSRAWFHDGRVTDAVFSPDGESVASASADGTVCVHRINELEGDQGIALKHPGSVSMVRFSPSNEHILTVCSDDAARIWDAKTGKMVAHPLRHNGAITWACFSPDGLRVLTTSHDRTARLWDTQTGEATDVVFKHAMAILHAEFSRDGKRIVTAGEAGAARVWDAETGKPISPVLEHRGPVIKAHFSPDGRTILTASKDRTFRIWDAETGAGITHFVNLGSPLTDAEFSPNGQDVVTTTAEGIGRVWNLEIGDWRPYVIRHDSAVEDAIFSPDGRSIATGGDDNTARIWSVATGEPLSPPLPHNGCVYRALYCNNGASLLTASQDGVVRLWEISRFREMEAMAAYSKNSRIVYSSDRRKRLKIESGGCLRVIDAASGTPIGEAMCHHGSILAAEFSNDGSRIITGSTDRTARIWNPQTGETIGEPLRHGSDVTCVAFSPDGKYVATGSEDNTARIWKTENGKPVSPLLRHLASLQKVVFSSDGRCLLTSETTGMARVWDASNGESLADPRDVKRLILLAKWLSAHQVDAGGNMVPLDNESLRAVWNELQSSHAMELLHSTDLMYWHDYAANDAEKAGDSFAVIFHVTRMIEAEKSSSDLRNRALLHARRGRAHAEQESWSAAAADFQQAIKDGLDKESLLVSHALVQLAAGNAKEYQMACQQLIEECGESASSGAAFRMGWPCLLGSTLSAELDEALEAISQRTTRDGKATASRSILRGAKLTRSGKFEEAIQVLDEGQILAEGIDSPRAWLFLALAEQGAGHAEEAKRWHRQACLWIDRHLDESRKSLGSRATPFPWDHRLELRLLREQVEKGFVAKR